MNGETLLHELLHTAGFRTEVIEAVAKFLGPRLDRGLRHAIQNRCPEDGLNTMWENP